MKGRNKQLGEEWKHESAAPPINKGEEEKSVTGNSPSSRLSLVPELNSSTVRRSKFTMTLKPSEGPESPAILTVSM